MKLIEGSALYILGGVTVFGVVAAFGVGFVSGICLTVKAVSKQQEAEKEDSVKVEED